MIRPDFKPADTAQSAQNHSTMMPVNSKPQRYRITSMIAKLVTAIGLFLWMISEEKLDLSELRIFTDHIWISLIAIAYWVIGPLYLASLRWKILLRGAGYSISVGRSVILQLIGFFFTTVMPGSLGGDFVKVYYLIKDNPDKEKSAALWAMLFDRLIGMFGLFFIGAVFISANFASLWEVVLIRPIIILVYGYILVFILFILSLKLIKTTSNPAHRPVKGLRVLANKIYEFIVACRIYRDRYKSIIMASALSTIAHGLSFVLFAVLTQQISEINTDINKLATVFPIGMLITTLPISLGGLGVGHLAFDQLFAIIHLREGANVYNAYFVSQTLLNLTGVIAYLLYKPKSNIKVPLSPVRMYVTESSTVK